MNILTLKRTTFLFWNVFAWCLDGVKVFLEPACRHLSFGLTYINSHAEILLASNIYQQKLTASDDNADKNWLYKVLILAMVKCC